LFEPEQPALAAPTGTEWIDAFLASPAFVAQRDRTRLPRPIAPARVAGYLDNIHRNGGTIELAALATRVGEPVDQLRMALTMVQRLLNVDGAEVLAVRGNSTVELNAELLRVQFEVDVP
jgi:stage V sporulation protein SpoVS